MPTLKIEGVGFNLSSHQLQNMSLEEFTGHAAQESLWPGLDQAVRLERLTAAWNQIQAEKAKRPALAPSKPAPIVATPPTIKPADAAVPKA